jgi:hypothetical protein
MAEDDLSSRETALGDDALRPGAAADSRTRASAPTHLAPGVVLFGAYEIIGILGSGGMGEVYRARHLSLGGQRAIKVMHAALAARRGAVERFHREARALLEVHHPAVVRCHDLLRDEAGSFFLVMEMIEGVSLADRLRAGPLPEKDVRALGARLAAGLAAAHACGVVHRDLAPDNVVLPAGRPEQAKLIDFGIAKVLAAGEETVAEGFKGKLAYASPEQLGFFGGKVDYRSDYYSLALVLCAAATGDAIEMGSNFAEAVEARRTWSGPPPGVPPRLRKELAPLLAFDPSERPDSIADLFGEGERIAASAAPPRPATAGWRWALAAGAAAALALAGAALLLARAPRPVPAPEPVAAPAPADAATPAAENAAAEGELARLRERLAELPGGAATVAILPEQVPDGAPYRIRLEADCACYPYVFLLDADAKSIELLYPNAYDRPKAIAPGAPFEIPSPAAQLFHPYQLVAEAGVGIDRIRVLLLPEPAPFSGDVEGGWSASPETPERMAELRRLLDHLPELPGWESAETALHIVR